MKTCSKWCAAFLIPGMVISTLLFTAGSAGATSNKSHLQAAWSALEHDYKNILAATRANNATAAESGFIAYSRDCIPLATFETSFSKAINADIFSIARLGNAWAWVGYITLTTNSSANTFRTETSRLTAAITKFTHDLSRIGL